MATVYGYARVSTQEQNLDLQIDELLKNGVEKEKIYCEKITGTKKDRPVLDELLSRVSKGDKVVVWKLDRIGRSMKHLIELVDSFDKKGVQFESLKEKIDTSSSTGKLIFNIFASLAEFERDMISERTKAGLQSARARGRSGGRPKKNGKVDLALKMYDSKEYSVSEIEDATGLSKATLYRRIRERDAK